MQKIRSNGGAFLFFTLAMVLLAGGCITITTGEIKGNKFYLERDFTVDILDPDWEVVRQEVFKDAYVRRQNTFYKISFNHKKSNGLIGVVSYELDAIGQARSLDIHVDDAIASLSGMKLSQKHIKVDGIDAIETIISSKYMFKFIFLKKDNKGYQIIYRNTPTYFDQFTGTFDKFVESFRTL